MSGSYYVIVSGINTDTHQPEDVIQQFAKLAKVSSEKASVVLRKKRRLKKDLEKEQAERLCEKLIQIGVIASVGQEKVTVEETVFSLVPLEEDNSDTSLSSESKDNHEVSELSLQALGQNSTATVVQSTQPNPESEITIPTGEYNPNEATLSSGNIRYRAPSKDAGFLGQDIFGDMTILNVIIGCIVAILCATAWSYLSLENGREFNWLAWMVGGAMGITVLLMGGSDMSSGTFAAILAIVAILLARQMTFAGMEQAILDGVKEEQRQLLTRRQALLADYDREMNDEAFVMFYRNYHSGPLDIKYGGGIKYGDENIIADRPFFESRIDAIVGMTYEEMESEFDEFLETTFKPIWDKQKPDFFGAFYTICLMFGAITAFRLGMGFD